MLAQNTVFSKLWDEAISCAVYLINRIYFKEVDQRWPLELFNGGASQISCLCLFRCSAFPYQHNVGSLKKFWRRDVLTVMLGYRSNRSA